MELRESERVAGLEKRLAKAELSRRHEVVATESSHAPSNSGRDTSQMKLITFSETSLNRFILQAHSARSCTFSWQADLMYNE